jgi:hypothetical protein
MPNARFWLPHTPDADNPVPKSVEFIAFTLTPFSLYRDKPLRFCVGVSYVSARAKPDAHIPNKPIMSADGVVGLAWRFNLLFFVFLNQCIFIIIA